MRKRIVAPWYLLCWHLLWFIPVHSCRVLLVVVAFCGWGPSTAGKLWERTE